MDKALRGIQELQIDLLSQASFDHLSFSAIDFKNKEVHSWSLEKSRVLEDEKNKVFDLASLTKPLLLGGYYLKNKNIFNDLMLALLEHRIDIPAYGVLSRKTWKKTIESYPLKQLKENQTRYSDYSSLRLMLEIGQEELHSFYKEELKNKHQISFWKDLLNGDYAPAGFRHGSMIQGQVHDPNAYNINEFCSHAGLFSDIDSLSQYLISLNEECSLLDSQRTRSTYKQLRPYFQGWDGVQNHETTLAGRTGYDHEHSNTFGFLGFTGTSIWIDPETQVGWVLLTNATQNYWHDREILNEIRRKSGQLVWPLFR